jgi:hypothetical protein
MNNERYNQIIDETYKNFKNSFPMKKSNPPKDYINSKGQLLTKETFIYKIKTDKEFSNRFGLKIEERELSLEERTEILKDQSDNKEYFYDNNGNLIIESEWVLNKSNIPTKLITVTYKDEIIESYDND